MNFAALILSLMAFVIGLVATPSISQTDEPRAVVLDSWWSGTWAKNGCEYVKIFVKSNERLINQIGCKSVTSCPTLMPRYAACLAAAINTWALLVICATLPAAEATREQRKGPGGH